MVVVNTVVQQLENKDNMKQFIKIFLSLILSLSLFACGSGNSNNTPKPKKEKKVEEVPKTEIKAEAKIDPTTLDPGQNYNYDFTTSDLWISTTNQDDYFYLVDANKKYYETGFSIYWYYNGEQVLDGEKNLVKDNHLISVEDSDLQFDLMFVDLFTAYDTISDQWYYREGLLANDVESLFFDQYVQSEDGNSLLFNDDFTATEVWKGDEGSGTWWAINSTQIIYYPENDKNGYTFDYYVTTNNALDYIDCFEMGTYYVTEQ